MLCKRPDGYHEIETIMLPVPIYDILEIVPTESFEYKSYGLAIPDDGNLSLVENAYQLMHENYGIGPVGIHLKKQIPIGAGLGGGSSDAAFTLKALNHWFTLGLSAETLKSHAASLGSDCPFFIENKPALATGRGEKLTQIPIQTEDLYLVLCNPDIHIGTAEAYQSLVPAQNSLKNLTQIEREQWQTTFVNDFEVSIGSRHRLIAEGIEMLKANGAFYAAMSGSGSSYFGLFYQPPIELETAGLIYSGKFLID